jgi:hypothetical protein
MGPKAPTWDLVPSEPLKTTQIPANSAQIEKLVFHQC